MNVYDIYIYFVIFIKIIFIILSINIIILKKKHEDNTDKYKKLMFWKSRVEFIFIASMALLLILLFNPYNKKNCVDNETRILLFLFGIILIITSKWDLFFQTSPIFSDFQLAL
jgi:hypothetical protein